MAQVLTSSREYVRQISANFQKPVVAQHSTRNLLDFWFLDSQQTFKLSVTLPSGEIKKYEVQPSHTIDQIKLHLFKTNPELASKKPSDFILAVVNKQGKRIFLQVEFLKFRKLSKNILQEWREGREIRFLLLEKASLQELKRHSISKKFLSPDCKSLQRVHSININSPRKSYHTGQWGGIKKGSSIRRKSVQIRAEAFIEDASLELEPSRKKKRLMNIGSKVFQKLKEDPITIELSAPFIPEERKIDEWVPPTRTQEDETIEAMEIEPSIEMKFTESEDDDYSILTAPDTDDIEEKLEELEREVEEQRAIRRHIEQQVESLSRILKGSLQKSESKEEPAPAVTDAVSVEKTESEEPLEVASVIKDDDLFKKLQQGLNHLSEVLKETSEKLDKPMASPENDNKVKIYPSSRSLTEQKKKKKKSEQDWPELKLEKIKDDFLKAEHNFVMRVLKTIVEVYYDPLCKNNIISNEDLEVIFTNIKPFYNAQREFYERCQSLRYSKVQFAGALSERMKEMQSFNFFFVQYHTRSVRHLKELKKSNKKFCKFMSERELKPISGGLDLVSLLVKPVSHFASYKLLLERYYHSLPAQEVEQLKFTEKMIGKMRELLDSLEAQRDEEENHRELSEIQSKLEKKKKGSRLSLSLFRAKKPEAKKTSFDFSKPGLKLMKQGDLLVFDSINETKERHFALCDNALVIMRKKNFGKKLEVIKVLELREAEISDITVADQKHSFIISTNQPYREVCIASTASEYEKLVWMKTLGEIATVKQQA